MKIEVTVKGILDREPDEMARLREGTPDEAARELAERSEDLSADFRELPEEETR